MELQDTRPSGAEIILSMKIQTEVKLFSLLHTVFTLKCKTQC